MKFSVGLFCEFIIWCVCKFVKAHLVIMWASFAMGLFGKKEVVPIVLGLVCVAVTFADFIEEKIKEEKGDEKKRLIYCPWRTVFAGGFFHLERLIRPIIKITT